MIQHWIKADTIFELEVHPSRPSRWEWKPSFFKTIGFWKKESVEGGWIQYDTSTPQSTERILEKNTDLMLKDEEIWSRPYVLIHYSTGNKSHHSERVYFSTDEEAVEWAEGVAAGLPHIHFKN